MKLKAIAATFKRGKFLRIYTMPDGEQWIGNGVAMYKMSGMPQLTPAVVLKIFDVPDDKHAEWNCELEDMPIHLRELCADDLYIPEQTLEQMKISIEWNGVTQTFLKCQNDILAVDEKFVKPLYDDVEYLRFAKRSFEVGSRSKVAIACYNALELQAIIMPYHIGGDVLNELKSISTYFGSYRYERLINGFSPEPNVDPQTGEVSDGDSDVQMILKESEDDEV